MARLMEVVCSASASNVYDLGAWIFTLLCCTYALPYTASAHSTNIKHFRVHGSQSRISLHNMARTWYFTHSKNSQERYALAPDVGYETDNNVISSQSPSLVKLLHINSWASQNRIRSVNVRQMPQFSSSLSKQNSRFIANTSLILRSVQHKRIVRPYDKKVFVYGKDDRLRIYPSLLRKFPYSNVVRLSTGCTGTLVTPLHVLTAAHCVHTGVDFRNNLEMLKVEVPDSMGVRSYYIEKIGIPGRWLHKKSIHEHQASWDYAVVKLSYGVHGRSQFFPLAVPTAGVLNENLQFLGFPNNKDDLWLSICPARSNKAMVDGNLIFTRCDSAVGNSGAAVLSDDSREGKKIIGVLSSTMPVGRMPYYTQFSIITALTWAKLYDVCAEIGDIGVQHRVCPPLEAIPRPRRYHTSNNVIPFFG